MNGPHDRTPQVRRFGRLLLGLAFLAVVGVGIATLAASAASRGGAARDDGPQVTGVSVRPIARPFTGDDGVTLQLDREVTIEGRGFTGTAFGPFVRFVSPDGTRVEAVMVVLESGGRITAYPPPGLRGSLRLEVENPDARTAGAKVSF